MRLQFGGLVHHVFGCGELAAVVQPGRYIELPPLILGRHPEIGKWALLGRMGCRGQHPGHFGHPLAVAAGIGGFGVDGAGNQLGDGGEQAFDVLLGLDQFGRVVPDGAFHQDKGLGEGVDFFDAGVEEGGLWRSRVGGFFWIRVPIA